MLATKDIFENDHSNVGEKHELENDIETTLKTDKNIPFFDEIDNSKKNVLNF